MTSEDTRHYWDEQADRFDDEPDHGLRDPGVRQAWRELLLAELPSPPAAVADLGCGTGSLSCLLAQEGYELTGVDLAPAMVDLARAKAVDAGLDARFLVGDAADPPLPERCFDVVLVRHVLWALPDPTAAVATWRGLLRDGGHLLLVEGRWHTGAGLSSGETVSLVSAQFAEVTLRQLPDPALWGGPITDERYLVTAR